VQHFRFEESGAVAGDGGHGKRKDGGSPGDWQCFESGGTPVHPRATKKLRKTGAFL
jgi:hypothetical protein